MTRLSLKNNFPILSEEVHGKPLIYLDSAATTQKPASVIEAIKKYYSEENSNVHRGVHCLSEKATVAYERARQKIKKFLNAKEIQEIVFTRGTTESINLVAATFGRKNVQSGDEVIISEMEHHSNIVPWQMLCEEKGATLRIIPMNDKGELIFSEFKKLLNPKTKLVAVGHMSNALGTINPIKEIIQVAHSQNVVVLIDGAQAASHLKVDVQDLDCDFYAVSGHKLYGPTGIGVLYAKKHLLEEMPPYQGGGDMIASVTFEKTKYNVLPFKFEAGTPNIAGAVGLGAALDYLSEIGLENIEKHEKELLEYGTEKLKEVPGLKIIGEAKEKASVLSFTIKGVHPHDIGTILDREGVAVRAGHHCAQPVMEHFGIPATTRASLGLYNTKEDIDRLVEGLHKVLEVFG